MRVMNIGSFRMGRGPQLCVCVCVCLCLCLCVCVWLISHCSASGGTTHDWAIARQFGDKREKDGVLRPAINASPSEYALMCEMATVHNCVVGQHPIVKVSLSLARSLSLL